MLGFIPGVEMILPFLAVSGSALFDNLPLLFAVGVAVKITVNIMIRPHAKSFIYINEEIEIMRYDIQKIQKLSVERMKKGHARLGVVFGVLDEHQKINQLHLAKLLDVCEGLELTFHKGVDETDVVQSIQLLSHYPKITNVLTAGGKFLIEKNISIIKEMLKQRGHLNLLLGGGLTLDNIVIIKQATKATDFHFGTAIRIQHSPFGDIQFENIRQLLTII